MNDATNKVVRDRYCALREHIGEFFQSQLITEHHWDKGPIPSVLPDFRVYCVAPKDEGGTWLYISTGASEVKHEDTVPLEFMIVAPKPSERFVELLAMTALYNIDEPLDLWHTFPIGEPWFENSSCDHFLVTLPYLHGPSLEICCLVEEHVHLYWLLPITKSELDFQQQHGTDALEELFEQKGLECCRPDRKSIV